MEKYPIIEIFKSFQGEGRLMGLPVTFIRFGGCNLSCPWCDTAEQLKDKSKYKMLTAKEIVDRVEYPNVIFTGGEPTLYNLTAICLLLVNKFGPEHLRAIETNGTRRVPECINFVACSPKPQSNYAIHKSITDGEEYRYTDYKYVADKNLTLDNIIKCVDPRTIIYIQPEFFEGSSSVRRASKLVQLLDDKEVDARLGLQAHKYWEVR